MWKLGGVGLALLFACNATVFAQGIPGGIPGAAPPPAAVGAVGQAGAAAGAAGNIWTKLCKTDEQKAKCKERLCRIKLIQLLNNSLAPVSALSGGLVGGCCPTVTLTDLRKPADSAEGAAARIKQDEAEAKARRAAVRFLATVDCRYWPEAQDALIKALRADRNECVRWEAAMSLNGGCCCTKPVIRALTIAVSCSNEDDNPIEKSPRVRAAARAALEHCVSCYVDVTKVVEPIKEGEGPEKKLEPEKKPEGNGVTPLMSNSDRYYEKIKSVPKSRLVADAKRVLEKTQTPIIESDMPPPGSRSVVEVMSHLVRPQTIPTVSEDATSTVVQEPALAPPTAPVVQKPVERIVPQPLPPSVQVPPSKPAPVTTAPVKPVGMTMPQPAPVQTITPAVTPAPAPVAPLKPVSRTTPKSAPVQTVTPVFVPPSEPQPVEKPKAKPTSFPKLIERPAVKVPTTQAPAPEVFPQPVVAKEEPKIASRVGRPVTQVGQNLGTSSYSVPVVATPTIRRVSTAPQTEQPTQPSQPKQKLVFQRAAYEVPTNEYQYPAVVTPAKSE